MYLRTDSRNNFESWQKDVASHFRFDMGKDHSGGAQNEHGQFFSGIGAITVNFRGFTDLDF